MWHVPDANLPERKLTDEEMDTANAILAVVVAPHPPSTNGGSRLLGPAWNSNSSRYSGPGSQAAARRAALQRKSGLSSRLWSSDEQPSNCVRPLEAIRGQ
eukprot:SAG31_NODE_27799_length_420_cov_0.641745_2_plen_99_part_01